MRPIRKLLPDAYISPDSNARRIVRFSGRYYESVMSGEKTTTIRWDDPISVGSSTLVFEDHPGFAHVDGEVLAIEPTSLKDLAPEYADGLRGHYPDMPDDAQLSRVTFRLIERS